MTLLPTQKGRKCRHVHYSGRRCPNTVFDAKYDRCGIHRKADGTFGTSCADCLAIKAAFPLRKELHSRKTSLQE